MDNNRDIIWRGIIAIQQQRRGAVQLCKRLGLQEILLRRSLIAWTTFNSHNELAIAALAAKHLADNARRESDAAEDVSVRFVEEAELNEKLADEARSRALRAEHIAIVAKGRADEVERSATTARQALKEAEIALHQFEMTSIQEP
jgi:hypothetical protein